MKLAGLAVIIGVVLWSGVAQAQPSALVFEGDAAGRDATLAMASARETLTAAAWKFGDATFTLKETKAMSACMALAARAPCVSVVIKKKNVARVAILSLENHRTPQGEYELIVSARLLVPGDNTFAFDQRYCSHCTDDTIASTTTALTQSLLEQLARDRGRTVLAVNSEPASAGVFVDDETAGVTDLKMNIVPGPHTVRIERQGYKPELRNVMGVEGKTITLHVKLVRSGAALTVPAPVVEIHPAKPAPHIAPTPELAVQPPVPAPLRPAPRSTLMPKLLIGFGGAAIVSGGVLILIDRPDSVAPKNEEQRRLYIPTLLPGSILLGSGAIAVVIGGYLLMRKPKTTTLVFAATQGGAFVGFNHGF